MSCLSTRSSSTRRRPSGRPRSSCVIVGLAAPMMYVALGPLRSQKWYESRLALYVVVMAVASRRTGHSGLATRRPSGCRFLAKSVSAHIEPVRVPSVHRDRLVVDVHVDRWGSGRLQPKSHSADGVNSIDDGMSPVGQLKTALVLASAAGSGAAWALRRGFPDLCSSEESSRPCPPSRRDGSPPGLCRVGCRQGRCRGLR